jgi:hypothetical protein
LAVWDRTRSWIIERREVGRARIHIHFGTRPPTLKQIAALRRVFPELARARPDEIRARISESGDLEVREYGYLEAQWVEQSAREADLPAILTNTTRYETVIVDRDQSAVLLIEDEEEHERTVREMIAAGVPVTHLAID